MSHESDPRLLAGYRLPPRQPKPGELIWEFRRADHLTFSCEMRFHGESYGWEAMILKDGEFLGSRRFVLRAEAEAWVGLEKAALERGGD